jgi:hypothetical protein
VGPDEVAGELLEWHVTAAPDVDGNLHLVGGHDRRQRHRHHLRLVAMRGQDRPDLDGVTEVVAVLHPVTHHPNPGQVH